jgi:DNA-binding NtrC family response regulator
MQSYPKVLLLSSEEVEARKWTELFRMDASVKWAKDLAELGGLLQKETFDALVCGWSLVDGAWSDALDLVFKQCPDLPVIVYSSTGDEQEWIQVLESGAFDLLIPPYQKRTVLPVLEQAVASCEARRFWHTGSYLKEQAARAAN